jgi:hypothetical protein
VELNLIRLNNSITPSFPDYGKPKEIGVLFLIKLDNIREETELFLSESDKCPLRNLG